MNKNNYLIIMAGGVGTRFWPMSRMSKPKQFIDILGTGRTLLQQTFDRFKTVCPQENIFVVTNKIYKNVIIDQIEGISESQILCEPSRRNTAPCIAYAAYKIATINPNANLIVAPSDHVILQEECFVKTINSALKSTEKNDWLVTLGITPSRPDTGYGYIQFAEGNVYSDDERIKKVKTFTEKPNLEIAKTFIESGDFLWNAGIFVWSLKSILKAFEVHQPDIHSIFNSGKDKYNTSEEESFINDSYAICKNISIDYGIMEKAENVYTLKSDFGWSDLGTWGSLHSISEKDDNNNAIVGDKALIYNTNNCIINVPNDKLVVVQGLDDFIVTESDDILLVCKKEDEQHIRQIVSDVKLERGEKFI